MTTKIVQYVVLTMLLIETTISDKVCKKKMYAFYLIIDNIGLPSVQILKVPRTEILKEF